MREKYRPHFLTREEIAVEYGAATAKGWRLQSPRTFRVPRGRALREALPNSLPRSRGAVTENMRGEK